MGPLGLRGSMHATQCHSGYKRVGRCSFTFYVPCVIFAKVIILVFGQLSEYIMYC